MLTAESGRMRFARPLGSAWCWPYQPCCAAVETLQEIVTALMEPATLLCTQADAAELPPPLALRLEGAKQKDAQEYMGMYRLAVSKSANGRPVRESEAKPG